METQKKYPKSFSFEFFPPKTDKSRERFLKTLNKLKTLEPDYCSVTFGAGGSTQEGTLETVLEVQKLGIPGAPHLSCIGSSKDSIRGLLDTYKKEGIKRIVALRGDLPSGMGRQSAGEFRHANELVEFIRAETGDHFSLEVAAYPEFHPQAKSASFDLQNFKRKVEAGADTAITQYFFNEDAYFHFVDSCEKMGLDLPIIPGIMPITNYEQLARFSEMCGADIPRWLRWRLQDFGDDTESLKAFGLDVTTEICDRLLKGGAPGIHFYCLNQAGPTMKIWDHLNISSLR